MENMMVKSRNEFARLESRILGAISILLVASQLSANGADWHQFLGLNRDAVSLETGLAREWPAGGPRQLWTVKLGPGFGGAAIQGGEVFVLDRVSDEGDLLRCFALPTGKERWRFEYLMPGRLPHHGSRSVPTVDEKNVYTIGPFGQVHCVDRETHEPVWSLDIAVEYGALPPLFGFAQSPLLLGNLVIVAVMSEEVGLAALDAKTGREIWRTVGVGESFSTPALLRLNRKEQIVFLSSVRRGGLLSSFDPVNGKLLWQSRNYDIRLPIPAPIQIGEGRLFLTGGYEAGSVLLDVGRDPKRMKFPELFRLERGSQIHLPFLIDEHLFFIGNENEILEIESRHVEGGLMCVDLNGSVKWKTGASPNFGRGGMIFADGLLIIQDGQNGILRLVQPDPSGYRQLAEADVFGVGEEDDSKMWAPMALSDGKLVLRSQTELKCLDLRDGERVE